MAHEIEEHDGLVLHREAAWHGLGIIVQDAPTPREALKIAGLDWECEQWPLSATDGESRLILDKHQANVRSDTKQLLGVVGKDWIPFQNSDAANFCEALAEQNDVVKLESAGSIRNGQKVWFLMKGESFSVRGHSDDEIAPYILCSNGFDGGTGFRCTPTMIRVVCANTLHAVIPNYEGGHLKNLAPNSFSCVHSGKLTERIEQAKAALSLYGKSVETQRELIDVCAAKDVNRADIQQFFLECYTKDFGGIADKPVGGKEERRRAKAMDGFNLFANRFDSESAMSGANAWTLFNSYSGYIQHDRGSRLKDPAKRAEAKLSSNLFGTVADKTIDAFAKALTLAS